MTISKSESSSTSTELPLRNPIVAGVLAWLVPGLGHFYQGRRFKALVYAICILGLFFFGTALTSDKCGPARCVYISLKPGMGGDMRYYYFAQVWVGAPAFPAIIQYLHDSEGVEPFWNGLMAPPLHVSPSLYGYSENENSIDNIRKKQNRRFELGTLMTSMAGLLNIFAIFDALFGPVNECEMEKKRQRKRKKHWLRSLVKPIKHDGVKEIK